VLKKVKRFCVWLSHPSKITSHLTTKHAVTVKLNAQKKYAVHCSENLKGRDHSEDIDIDWKITSE